MRKILLLTACCVFAFAAYAKDVEKAEPITPEQQAALICQSASMMGQKLKGAEYVPGVDAYGNPVTPADIDQAMPFEIPDEIQVPINMDVMAALGVTTPPLEGKGSVGTLIIQKGGALFFNDLDITNTIESYCTKHLKKMKMEDTKQ
jgi:hypothetical protein